jgi:hypothetical protein
MRGRAIHRDESGSALLLVTLILLMLGLFGFAALNAVTRDQQVAGYLGRKKLAFYAAEAGVAKALETLTTNHTPTVPVTSLGDALVFPSGLPTFRPDTTAADPIQSLGTGAYPGMSLNIGQGGTATYQLSYWRIKVEGRAPGGSVARVETVSGALTAN